MELNKADYIQLKRAIEKREEDYGDRLYHYTSLNTFLSYSICMTERKKVNVLWSEMSYVLVEKYLHMWVKFFL